MIGDQLTYYDEYRKISEYVIERLQDRLEKGERLCISVGGESGCGKTSLAYAIKLDIERQLGLNGFLFQGDDYFYLPPAKNHQARLDNLGHVGMQEVNLKLLDENLAAFKQVAHKVVKPLVNYEENVLLQEQLDPMQFDFCLVEGTYVSALEQPDYKVFIKSTYLDTHTLRIMRARDLLNEFNERVLEIEHSIIKEHQKWADLIVDKELNISINTNHNDA